MTFVPTWDEPDRIEEPPKQWDVGEWTFTLQQVQCAGYTTAYPHHLTPLDARRAVQVMDLGSAFLQSAFPLWYVRWSYLTTVGAPEWNYKERFHQLQRVLVSDEIRHAPDFPILLAALERYRPYAEETHD